MTARQSLKFGVAAAALALAIIGAALVANPWLSGMSTSTTTTSTTPSQQGTQGGNFLVMLTDPPKVPQGTTQLNMTYTVLSLHVTYANGTSKWVPVSASGTVNLLSLVNVTQTLGSANIPQGSSVNTVQFTISSVSAEIGGQSYPVTTLSSQLLVPIRGQQSVNQTLSGALLDLSPTLVQIHATNSTGGVTDYYVLVPSATAIIKSQVGENQDKVGTKSAISQTDRDDLEHAQQAASANVTITSATLSSSGNKTALSITLKNQGSANATVFGLTLNGNFSAAFTPSSACSQTTGSTTGSTSSTSTTTTTATTGHGHEGNPPGQNNTSHGQGQGPCNEPNRASDHPDTIPFRINGTTLVPLFGDDNEHGGIGGASSVTIQPGQSVTLSFSGVIGLKTDAASHGPTIVITAISGSTYTARLMGEGSQTIQVKAS